nr:MAG TPA: Two-component sensor protein CpxA, periplasmic domain [Caudoviricetes sp.]
MNILKFTIVGSFSVHKNTHPFLLYLRCVWYNINK